MGTFGDRRLGDVARLVTTNGTATYTTTLPLTGVPSGWYQAIVGYRASTGSGAWVSWATSYDFVFAVDAAVTPGLTITAPTGQGHHTSSDIFTASWTTSVAPTTGQFAVWVRSPENDWYWKAPLVPADGRATYSTTVDLTGVAPGLGYQVILAYEPIANTGLWKSWATSPGSFTVTTTSASTVLNVRDYGARGDGVTDDRAAIQACITAATAAGKWVYIPAGTYLVSGTGSDNWGLDLPSNCQIRGDGAASVLYSTATYPILISGKTGITLQNFALDSNLTTSGQAGVFTEGNCSYLTFDGLTITDMHWGGISTEATSTISHSTFKNLSMSNIGEFGININGGGSYLTFEDCTVTNVGSKFPSSYDYPPHSFYLKACNNVTMLRCTGTGVTGTPQQSAAAFTINDVSDSTFTDCYGAYADIGIAVNRYPSTGCSNLTFYHCGGANNAKADRWEYGVSTNIIWDATCYGTYDKYLG